MTDDTNAVGKPTAATVLHYDPTPATCKIHNVAGTGVTGADDREANPAPLIG